ncbi:hypothetical protein [Streptomyces sp. KN37]|uniref:hypothetical protein n=1 Tax=Streptomyces sp. KN37 TaxID=3090667 RepID=UPI002A74F5B0|nr:hypothetical protein [Streptomyces sp. KN37]WPO76674.1 hypothetical protein R9806_39250 [Streptomyces sp. KN37]
MPHQSPVSQFDEEHTDDDRPGTQGTAYNVNGRYPTSKMRFWNIGSDLPTEGLDPMVLDHHSPGAPSGTLLSFLLLGRILDW